MTTTIASSIPSHVSGVDYITFLELADKDGTVKGGVLEADELGQESSDFYSSPIFIENGIPIGAKGGISTVLYVCLL